MKKYLNSPVTKNFIIYGATNALASGLPLLLLPFLTDYLSPADMAMVAIFQLFFNFLQPFIGLNGSALSSVVFYSKTKEEFAHHRSSIVWLIFLSAISVVLILLPFKELIFEYTGLQLKWIAVLIVFIFFDKFNEFLLAYWRLENKAWLFAIWRLLRVSLELLLSIVIVLNYNSSWEGRAEGIVFSGILVGCIALFIILSHNNWKLGFRKNEILEILKFGIPFIPHVLGGVIISYADLLFIRNMVGEEATGLYSVGYQVGLIIGLIQNSFNQAWVPWFYSKLNDLSSEWNTKLVKLTYLYFAALILIATFLYLGAPLIFSVFIDDRYVIAQSFVGWVAFGFAINGMYKMVVNYLIYLKLTKMISKVTFFVGALNLILNYVLIKQNGAIGAAQATAISFLTEFVIIWFLSAKHFPMNWRLNK